MLERVVLVVCFVLLCGKIQGFSVINEDHSQEINQEDSMLHRNYMEYEMLRRSKRQTVTPAAGCSCVPRNTCYQNLMSNDGSGQIDFRIVAPNDTATTLNPLPTTTPVPGTVTCQTGYEYCCVGANVTGCGVRYAIPLTPTTTPGPGQARYGSQPWQALLLSLDNITLGGGVLIDALTVLTAAHKLAGRTASTIKVRMGEWNLGGSEPYPPQEILVREIRIHPGYCVNCSLATQNLFNDVAILKLATLVTFSDNPNINTACLPVATTVFDGQYCLVYGWGKDSFTGVPQNIPKEVEVPVLANGVCQDRLRTTRLGTSFVLNTNTFLCAGGDLNKDACTGDGGAGLVCLVNGRYQVAGLVAWGIGCANGNIPGVYVRITTYIDWIRNQTLF